MSERRYAALKPVGKHPGLFFLLVCVVLFFISCGSEPEVIADLGGRSYRMVDQDSSRVTFPADFSENIAVVGFIYTNCPDVCPAITANMSNINRKLDHPDGVHFVGVTFDPERDTPSVLKQYMQQFKLDPERFTFITGDSATVDSLLRAMDIRAEISSRKTSAEGEDLYFMNHTNRISVMDQRGRLRLEYSGSYANPEQVVEGINRLR